MNEPVTLVEIDRDVCTLTFGVAPCTATGTKCYNTWKTCADRPNFAAGIQTLRFAKPRADLPLDLDAVPSVMSTSASPTELNVGDVDASSGPLGKRAQATITLQDHPTSDALLDPYVSERPGNPWERGTFWTKLKARWPTPKGRALRIVDGYLQDVPSSVNNSIMPNAILRAATSQQPDRALLRDTLIAGRPLADVNNSGTVTSADAIRYNEYNAGTAASDVVEYIENVMHPYMLANPDLYAIYLTPASKNIVNSETRAYLIDAIDGPDSRGRVTIRAVDPLRILDDKTSQAPILSRGELAAAIDNTQTTLLVAGATLSDYPASGTLRIGSELMTYTARATSGTNIEFTGLTRATDGTVAAAHEIESRVQTCIRYSDVNAWQVARSIIETYAPAAYPYVDLTQWTAEANQWLDGFIVSAVISEPTGLNQLLAELCRDAQFFIWWDERQQKILLKAVRPPTEVPQAWNEDANILAGSQTLVQRADERISQIWYYYQPRDLSKRVDDEANYRKVRIRVDGDAESVREYNEVAVTKIFSRWVRTDAIVTAITARLLTRYRDTPYYLTISVDAKDRGLWTADVVDVTTRLLTNEDGLPLSTRYQIISAQETSPGSVVKYVLQNYNFAARYGFWMADNAPIYDDATEQERLTGGWWADANGKIGTADGYEWQ